MRPVYGRSPWVDGVAKSRVPSYPKHSGNADLDVAIIGGGLTGCAAAYVFAAAGHAVTLFEADRIGRLGSGRSSGWLTDDPPATFAELDAALGRRAARHAFQAWRRAALDASALLRRLDVKCRLDARPSLLVAQTPEQAAHLARDQKSRKDAGLDAAMVPQRTVGGLTGFPVSAARRTRDSATLDPYRVTLGLAAAAVQRGARIFERSPVTATSFTRTDASLTVGTRRLRARRIVVTMGNPASLFTALARHFTPRASFLVLTEPVPLKVRRALGSREHLIRDSATPPHRVSWIDDERLLIAGADSEVPSSRSREQVLVQRTGQLMYELSTFYPDISGLPPAYGWDAEYCQTSTSLPVIGPHRNYPHHLFACGGHASVTSAFLASRVLLRHHLDEPDPSDASFGFGH
ncbi:MAG: FAD-binding oxidoreductase [Vicinamibacterales bacterium]